MSRDQNNFGSVDWPMHISFPLFAKTQEKKKKGKGGGVIY